MDIIGVLDFLKFKIQSWGNTNVYSYEGRLFNNNIIMVIGSNSIEEVMDIVIFVYLSRLAEKDPKLLRNTPDFENSNELETFLKEEIEKNIKKGYPHNHKLEQDLKHHLESLLKN
ncbi:MAG: hypothetical protein EU531_03605 [Promethearchaeota archaeon]|nr:MAG: hypothetical protein EU531_03605 [Candidatus Lokiarchaeota archaeon]